jgi:hypothetical protein
LFLYYFTNFFSHSYNSYYSYIYYLCIVYHRPDSLPGKCFGLTHHVNTMGLWDITITSAEECRSLCCNLGERCTSWQYQAQKNECLLGGPVRLGLEGADTADWCDPFLPAKWTGNRLLQRTGDKCEWGEAVPNQCFGLGAERLNIDGTSKTAEQCETACCEDETCEIWQQQEGRGCYYNKNVGIQCQQEQLPFEGGRKCIPRFCGSPEEEKSILQNYEKMKVQHSLRQQLKGGSS